MHNTRRLVLFCVFATVAFTLQAQKDVNSPFARYGLGNLEPQGTYRTLAMGGISSGIRNSSTINFLTPASYSSIDTISFLFDFAFDFAVIRVNDETDDYYSSNMNFRHILMGFPIMKDWGFSFGLLPFTNGFYTISNKGTVSSEGTDAFYELHRGIGGYQKFYMGTGFSPWKFLSLGVNGYLIFGDISRYNDFIFSADNNFFNTRKMGNHVMHGLSYEASAQFMIPLPKNSSLNLGLTYAPDFKLKTGYDDMLIRYSNIQTSNLAFDTLYYDQTDTSTVYPKSFRGGIAYNGNDKITIGADVTYTLWSQASLPGCYGTYADALTLHAGLEYVPDRYSIYNLFSRIEYRLGGRFAQSYALYGGNQVNEYGITFGAGIPLRRSRSKISLFFDLSTRGNPEDTYFKESRMTVGASLNLYDLWFLKSKYE